MEKRMKALRIYVSNTDKAKHDSLYESIAFAAQRHGLAGVTVYKGLMGYGSSSELHSSKFWELTEKVPVIIEAIDEAEEIDTFVAQITPWIKEQGKGCLVTSQDIEILLCQKGALKKD